MNQETFQNQLKAEGFENCILVERDADGSMGEHAHPFEAKALILQGEIRIQTEDGERTYRAGDIFHLPANQLHHECYGPQGVTYQVGRR